MTGKFFRIYHLTAKITSDDEKWLDFYSKRFDSASDYDLGSFSGDGTLIDQTRLVAYTYGCFGADLSEYGFQGTNYRSQSGANPILNDCENWGGCKLLGLLQAD